MQSALAAAPASRSTLWTARIIGAFIVLFLVFDAFGKFARPQPVVDAFVRLGMPISLAPAIGTLLSILVLTYIIPRTRAIGTILLTAYLGGAVAVQLRAGSSPFETLFPVITGVLVWVPVYLTDERMRGIFQRPQA